MAPLRPARHWSARDRSRSGGDRTGGEALSSAPARVVFPAPCRPPWWASNPAAPGELCQPHPRAEEGQELSRGWSFVSGVRGGGRLGDSCWGPPRPHWCWGPPRPRTLWSFLIVCGHSLLCWTWQHAPEASQPAACHCPQGPCLPLF